MPLEGLAQGAEAAGEPAAVDGHDETHRRALVEAGLVVSTGDVVLDSVIERLLFCRHLKEAIFDTAVGNGCCQRFPL